MNRKSGVGTYDYGSMQKEAERRVYEMQRKANAAMNPCQVKNRQQDANCAQTSNEQRRELANGTNLFQQKNKQCSPEFSQSIESKLPKEHSIPVDEYPHRQETTQREEPDNKAKSLFCVDSILPKELVDDPERVLLLLMIVLLFNGNADPMLLLALMYIL